MLSSLVNRAPSLPASELPMPSGPASDSPWSASARELSLRRSQKELERLEKLLSRGESLWPAPDETDEE